MSEQQSDTSFTGVVLTEDEKAFLDANNTMVISSLSHTNVISSSVVYYTRIENSLYVLTKTGTEKSRNMSVGNAVAVTIYNQDTMGTIQIQAFADADVTPTIRQNIFDYLMKKINKTVDDLPVAQVHAGGYILYRLRPIDVVFHQYNT